MEDIINAYYVSQWGGAECNPGFASTAGFDMVSEADSKAKQEPNDGLGNIMDRVGGSDYSIQFDHPHVIMAFELLEGYPFPTSLEDYCRKFRFREWDIVCETMLVAVRLGLLDPSPFQRFLLGIFIHEHAPRCCCRCGLTTGHWCGEWLFSMFVFGY